MVTAVKNPVVQYVEGVIARANDRGIVLDGADTWLNVSRYADNPPAIPAVGLAVRAGLDKDRFIRTIEVLHASSGRHQPDPDDDYEPPFDSVPEPERTPQRSATSDRDLHICRQACINSAIAIFAASPGEEVTIEGVLAVAAQLERWVNR